MRVISTNLGKARNIDTKSGQTGIFKEPVTGPVAISKLGITGDTIVDTKNHGGAEQAVYLYGDIDYDWWSAELGRPLAPGTFGENLTIEGFASADILIGDRFQIGDVLLEVTSPRIACVTLTRRMDDKHFVAKFHQSKRPGAYTRVLEEGAIEAGMDVEHIPFEGARVALTEIADGVNTGDIPQIVARRFLAVPIHAKMRADIEAALRQG